MEIGSCPVGILVHYILLYRIWEEHLVQYHIRNCYHASCSPDHPSYSLSCTTWGT